MLLQQREANIPYKGLTEESFVRKMSEKFP